MKSNLLLLALLLPMSILAQVKTSKDFNIDVGKPYPVVDAPIKEYFHHDGEILAIKIHGDITYQKFNANSLDFKSMSELSKKKEMPKGFVHEEFVQQGERIFQFYNVWDKPNKTEQIFVQELTFSNPKPKKSRLLFKVNGKLISQMGQNKIEIYQSFNESNYLIVYRRKPTEKKDKKSFDKIGMMVFDEDMQEVWKKEVTMPYTEANMDNLGYTIDSQGNAYVLARVREGEKEGKEARLEVMMYDGGDEPEILEIKADGKHFPHGITLHEGKNNKTYCAGFYGEGNSANGVYVSVLGKNGIENEQFYDIPLDIINQNKSERTQKKNAKKEDAGKEIGIYELGLDEIVINPDGSFVLLSEVFYIRTTTSYNSSSHSTTTTYHYYYMEMFMAKISADGEMVWMNKMPKNQKRSTSSGGYGFGINSSAYYSKSLNYDLSYKYLKNSTDHYLLYLDNVKNLTLANNKYPAMHSSGKGGYLTAYKINDSSGEVSKLSLFDMKNVNGVAVYQFNTDRFIQTSEDELLLELYKKKKEDILLRININE
ncbi:MAG: hypothetical protein JKY42_03625 [Flavobacteriales bacterium]|nr:hypothetical protein [Flavobacteriales bacterium]